MIFKTGLSFNVVLALLFIAFKLTDIIVWSWWWVLAPLWIPFVAIFTVAFFRELFVNLRGV